MNKWVEIMQFAMNESMRKFDSSRMVHQYYKFMYKYKK
jgi:hypothetical protein